MKDLREKLFELQDEEYRKFHVNLCPNVDNIIGIRVPKLREIAKEIAKDNPREFLDNYNIKYYEEIMIYGCVIGYMKENLEERLEYLDKFVPMIDNWAICDSTLSTYKFIKKNITEVRQYIQKYIDSDKEFELRFAVITLMDNYIIDEYIDEVLQIYNSIKHDGYYVKMAVAWGISVCYVKYPEKTMTFLKNNDLDNFTYNKALQKIIESNRVDNETKNKIRSMKRKNK